jgi:long-chain acyl-CoA synthetase
VREYVPAPKSGWVRLSGYKVPRSIVFVDVLPREDSGKVFKRKIRAQYWKDHDRSI